MSAQPGSLAWQQDEDLPVVEIRPAKKPRSSTRRTFAPSVLARPLPGAPGVPVREKGGEA